MCRRGPLTFADDGQFGAVNDEVPAGARAGAPKREGAMLTASRERGVIGCREIDAQHPEDRGQDALGLTQRSVEDETERQGGFDGEIGRLELPAPPADASRCPRGDRVGREPEGDVASPHEGSVVLGPVPDAIRCLVLRMHSRLHIEIMTRRRSRWATCRPLLAHRAESAHQRPQILALTVDRDEDFVQKPRISESTLTSLQPPGAIGAELPAPLPNSFVRHDDAAFGQQILDIPEAQAVSVIQPDGVADDFRRKAMPKVAGSSNVHPGIVPRGELT